MFLINLGSFWQPNSQFDSFWAQFLMVVTRMELLAPINALKEMSPNSQINIYTDSQYVKLGITDWVNKWINNNWQTSKKEDVKNKDLWIELYNLNKSLNVKWNWVKAHAGNSINEEVDLLAKKAANLD